MKQYTQYLAKLALVLPVIVALLVVSIVAAQSPVDPDSFEDGEPVQPMGVEGDWILTFSDEFNADELNTTKWNDQWGAPGEYWGPPNTVRWSEEWMLPQNVIIEDGLLRLRHQVLEGQITSGVVTTNGKFTQQYGFFEARLRANETRGVVSAFWMQYDPNRWPPEADIVEILANDRRKPVMTIHYGYPLRQAASYVHLTDIDFTADFHVFGFEWNENEVAWFVDGEEVERIPNPGYGFTEFEFYIQFNMHSGNSFSGYPDRDNNEATFMEVDYVRAWQYEALIEGDDEEVDASLEENSDESPND